MSTNPASVSPVHLLEVSTTGALPRPLSSFVGRQHEIGEIEAMLRDGAIRLLTLVGPGGVGKTRLAVESAARVADTFPDGVWFVDLAPLIDPALVIPTIARTIGLQESPNKPVALHLRDFLRNRRTLLLLDNLEQVIAAAPDLADLISDCPELVILATSREPLAVGGEQEYPVQPLATDPHADAVRLLVERARAFLPSFALTGEIEPLLAEICQRLDGLPLAIELAAARIKTLPPYELLARLDRRLPVLTGGRRDAPHRQQTMRDTIAWSYDLLSPEEQALFRQLSIFTGGFTLDAAEAIGGDLSLDIVAGVVSLVDKSLLRQVARAPGAARYSMLEMVREYGLEQLETLGEARTVRACHAKWVAAFAERSVDLLGPISIDALARLAAEHDNARAALHWTIDVGDTETGLRIATAFFKVWHIRGFYSEGRQWLRELLALKQQGPAVYRAAALFALGWFALLQGDLHAAEAAFDQVLSLARVAAVGRAEGSAWSGLGICAYNRGEFATAETRLQQALTLARSQEDDKLVIGVLCNLGIVATYRGDLMLASRYFAESLELDRQTNDPWSVATTLANVSWVARKQGDFRRAAEVDRERLAINRQLANREQQADCCLFAAGVAVRLGQSERAARLAAAAARERDELGFQGDPAYQGEVDAIGAAIRAALNDADFQHEWAAGRAMALDDALADADAVFAEEEAAPLTDATPADPAATFGLTPRETEVLRLIARDWSNQQIADALFLSRRTVHKHVENILAKLGTDSRAGAAVWAVRHGLE
jgi:predicted ATPase/DNA-binding NarL/FixJ family response regulator